MNFTDALNPELCVTVPIPITANGHQISTTALLDSGAAGNFMSSDSALHNRIALIQCSSSLTVEATDGRPLGTGHISFITQELLMQTGLFHTEKIQFYILPTSNTPGILGFVDMIPTSHGVRVRSHSGTRHVTPSVSHTSYLCLSDPLMSKNNPLILIFPRNILTCRWLSVKSMHPNCRHTVPADYQIPVSITSGSCSTGTTLHGQILHQAGST